MEAKGLERRPKHFIQHLEEFVSNYNRSQHSSLLSYTPKQVADNWDDDELIEKIEQHQLGKANERVQKSKDGFSLGPLEIGDNVRLRLLKKPVEKGYKQRWSDVVYRVKERLKGQDGSRGKLITHDRYVIETQEGERVRGFYYRGDLLLVRSGEVMERIAEEKGEDVAVAQLE
jgi:hypothetical protein